MKSFKVAVLASALLATGASAQIVSNGTFETFTGPSSEATVVPS